MICELQIKFFFCPFGILWYKFLVLCVLSEFSKLLELRFVSSSSKTSRSSGTIKTSQSSISSHPAFPDAGRMGLESAAVIDSQLGAEVCPFLSDLQQTCLGLNWRVWGLFPDKLGRSSRVSTG